MANASRQSVQVQGWLDRLRAGDETARDKLINCACDRLTRLTRKMLKGYPRVKRWEQTDDVSQNAAVRLYRALGEVRPASPADFFRLAALNIRRELLDLAKHYYGPRGPGTKHASVAKTPGAEGEAPAALDPPEAEGEPNRLAAWSEFHRQIDLLPDEEREIFDLLWYQGLSQAEAASLLNVSERTIKRRWQSARLRLHDALHGEMPEL
jgi:RNA polymerase sigma-70 factor (ECF subfamily)